VVLVLACALASGCYLSRSRSAGDGADAGVDTTPDLPACSPALWASTVDLGIAVPTGTHLHVDLVWVDGVHALAWDRDDGAGGSVIELAWLGSDGMTASAPRVVSDVPSDLPVHPMLAWTGSSIGVSWERLTWDEQIRIRILDSSGLPRGPSRSVTSDSIESVYGIQADMTWVGDAFAVTWPWQFSSPNAEGVLIAFLDSTGAPVGDPVSFSDGITSHPVVERVDTYAALLWRGAGTHLSVVSSDGTLAGDGIVGDPRELGRRLAVSPDGYGVAWSDEGFYFMPLTREALDSGDRVRLGDDIAAPQGADVTWTRWGWAVAWQDGWHPLDGSSPVVRVAIVSPVGEIVLDEKLGSIAPGGIAEPHLSWTGSELAIVYNDRDGDPPTTGNLAYTKIVCE
jgi:hypothetical protein